MSAIAWSAAWWARTPSSVTALRSFSELLLFGSADTGAAIAAATSPRTASAVQNLRVIHSPLTFVAGRAMVSRFSATARLDGMAQAPALPRGFELPLEPRLPRIGSIDQVAVEERAALARQAVDQEGGEALGARDRRPDDGPDDARGRRHARQGRGALLEGRAARPGRPHHPVGRRGLRLPEPRAGGEGAARRHGRQGRGRRHVLPLRPGAARREARATCATRSSSAPTRSTW